MAFGLMPARSWNRWSHPLLKDGVSFSLYWEGWSRKTHLALGKKSCLFSGIKRHADNSGKTDVCRFIKCYVQKLLLVQSHIYSLTDFFEAFIEDRTTDSVAIRGLDPKIFLKAKNSFSNIPNGFEPVNMPIPICSSVRNLLTLWKLLVMVVCFVFLPLAYAAAEFSYSGHPSSKCLACLVVFCRRFARSVCR